ncbi:MAG: T9SS type A sorting domain-containing protein [Bacteroidota bacterium]
MKYFVHKNSLLLLFLLLLVSSGMAQTGCPGCLIDLSPTLAEDTIFLSQVDEGFRGAPYDHDLSFRMPKTTDPVAANDPGIPGGLNIDEITIVSLSNLPPGLSWEANKTTYDLSEETDGCIKICGTPLAVGLYTIEVRVSARIAFINTETSFTIDLNILPAISSNNGFTMNNNIGCGQTLVSFQNNIASNGNPGFTYSWNFGNGGSSAEEEPGQQLYTSPGVYPVNYQVIIDTVGFILTKVKLLEVDCDDLTSKPDIFIRIKDPEDNLIYESSEFTNTDMPVEVNPNLMLGGGNYLLEAIDADSGLEFSDDDCAITNFNQLSNGILTGQGFRLQLDILNPVDTVEVTDTVTVYAVPQQPIIQQNLAQNSFCEGDSIILTSSYTNGNQWFFDGEPMAEEMEEELIVKNTGLYAVQYTSPEGCISFSNAVLLEVIPLPQAPAFTNDNNLLSLNSEVVLPDDFELQWYQDGVLLPTETGFDLCATTTGEYELVVTDVLSGCSNSFLMSVDIDPDFDCTVGVAEVAAAALDLRLFPNPTSDQVQLRLKSEDAVGIRLFDATGRLIIQEVLPAQAGEVQAEYHLGAQPAGLYFLNIQTPNLNLTEKIIRR